MKDFQVQHETPQTHPVSAVILWIGRYWFQLVVTMFIFQIYSNRGVQLVVNNALESAALVSHHTRTAITAHPEDHQELAVLNVAGEKPTKPKGKKWNATDFRNLSFILNPTLAERKQVPDGIVQEKLENCRKYVRRFAKSAMSEMEQFGIPASITLAQGLLESDAGGSRLATESNNHFGIKCRTKCRGCTCRNYADDDVYDMFRVFDSSWESFREHSKLLQIDRYSHLQKLGTKDYKGWANGLKKAGYATDKDYHKKLIRIIEELDLQQFDK